MLQLKLTVQPPTLYGGDCHSSWENDIWRLETCGGAGQRAVPQSAGQVGGWRVMAKPGDAWRRPLVPFTVLRRDQLTWTVGAGSMHWCIRSSHAANLESGTEHKKEQWRLLVCLPKYIRCFWGT